MSHTPDFKTTQLAKALTWMAAALVSSCVSPNNAALAANRAAPAPAYTYQVDSGKCVNTTTHEEGYNRPDPAVLFAHLSEDGGSYGPVDAQCIDFAGFDFNAFTASTAAVFDHWNFNGAKFTGAKLHFIQLSDASLLGTDLRGFVFGYVEIHATGDRFTQSGICPISANFTVDCRH